MIRRLAPLLAAVALVVPSRAAAFTPTDPLVAKQWYLNQIHAFDFWPDTAPTLAPVRVAIVDSGIDLGHPEFAGRVALAKSFVGGSVADQQGHGTFVAGIIAANSDNNEGISGIALSAQLLVAKVVRSDGTISPAAEAKAIRWAADHDARVINLSLGGLRSRNKNEDTYSTVEQDAIEYAYAKGSVLVAAVGNGDQAPKTPWDLASYPAALPHVIGVSALAQDGSVPAFSNRDAFFNDMAAPGVGIVSTLPRAITAQRPSCVAQGYSICGPAEFRSAEGTSYAAAEVSGAAALLIAMRPALTAAQVAALLERSATDSNPATGCSRCVGTRDPYTGWGELDVEAALKVLSAGTIPAPDHYESNDDAGSRAFALWGRSIDFTATLDFWDDQIDVYKIKLRQGQTVAVSLHGPPGVRVNVVLWRPGTQQVEGLSPQLQARRLTASVQGGPNAHFLHRATQAGWYYVELKLPSAGAGQYRLHISKSRA